MYKDQIPLLIQLAKELEKQDKSKESAIQSLHQAGIMTKSGRISKHYPNLKRFLSQPK